MNLEKGDKVILTNDDDGKMYATVSEVNEHWAVFRPTSAPLREWFPQGYLMGRAHWDFRVTLRDQ